MPSVVLVNDTSLYSTHFGCQLVGQTIREQLARKGVDLIASFPRKFDPKIAARYFKQADLVIINGEGTIHHGRGLDLLKLSNDYPCALINSVFQENGIQPLLKNFLYISMRESLSAQEVRKQGAECHIVPDAIFASKLLNAVPIPQQDIEIGYTDNVTNPMSGFSPKSDLAYNVLSKLARCKTLCVGRFHAAIAASVLRIPFATWESNTWKVRGMMHDMGIEHLHFDTQNEAAQNIPAGFDPRIDEFVTKAKKRIKGMFAILSRLAGAQNDSPNSEASDNEVSLKIPPKPKLPTDRSFQSPKSSTQLPQ